MANKEIIEDIDSLIADIDACTGKYIKSLHKKSEEDKEEAIFEMSRLMVASQQELSFLRDYIISTEK